MATPLEELISIRKEKLEKLKSLGVTPYASTFDKKHTIKDARSSEGANVQTAGRIMATRGHGAISFVDLVDETGKIQLLLKKESLDNLEQQISELLDIGDIVGVTGKVFTTKAGEITIEIERLVLLAKSLHPLPSTWHGLKDIEERYRQRYVDLILNGEVRTRLEVRSKVVTALRELLDSKGFLEVETPTLQPIYGGGFAKPFVTHHNALESNFYLRISDEMYLKRLIVGGFEKVYEITKVFRNEGIDTDHNPEFTMFEAQIAYQDYRYGMEIIEEIFRHITTKVLGDTKVDYQGTLLDFGNWTKLSVAGAVKQYTNLDPLTWTSLEQAKKDASSIKIPPQKTKELGKIQTIGEVTAFVFEEAVEEKLVQPTMIFDYPVEVSPLAQKSTDPRFTQRFEMFAMGMEIGNNYSELNDPIDLRQRFVEEKKREEAGFDEAHQTDYDYINAIEHGFPPTCGLGVGIDRVVMLLTNAPNLKEVIAFPTLKPEVKMPVSKKKK